VTYRYILLNPELKPWAAYSKLDGFQNGIEEGPWMSEALERGYGIGIMPGESDLIVIDCDTDGQLTADGMKTTYGYRELLERVKPHELPPTLTAHTRSPGHLHFYYAQNPDHYVHTTRIRKWPAVDIKVSGFVVHHSTQGYGVYRDYPVAKCPDWLAELIGTRPRSFYRKQDGTPGDRLMTDDHAEYLLNRLSSMLPDSGRNATLNSIAFDFRNAGRDSAEDFAMLMKAASDCGLSDSEAIQTINSAFGR
jgi:Bifunctional DNA primase/polymerase, N-terminal